MTQDQIGFELQTDVTNGLTPDSAAMGRIFSDDRAAVDAYFKLLKESFSFIALLLWMAALLCFVAGVGLPPLGVAILNSYSLSSASARAHSGR